MKRTLVGVLFLTLMTSCCYAEEPITYGTSGTIRIIDDEPEMTPPDAIEPTGDVDISSEIDKELDKLGEEQPTQDTKEKQNKKLFKKEIINTVYATKNGSPFKKFTLEKTVKMQPTTQDGKEGYIVTVAMDYIKRWSINKVYKTPIISTKKDTKFYEGDVDINSF